MRAVGGWIGPLVLSGGLVYFLAQIGRYYWEVRIR